MKSKTTPVMSVLIAVCACAALAAGSRPQATDPAAGAASPVATVRMGDGTIDGSFLQPYNNAWVYTVTLPNGQTSPQGIWSDHMQWTTVGGRQVMMRVQGTTFVSGVSNSIRNVFDPKTMAPINSETHGIDGSIFRRTFTGAHVVTETLASAKDPGTKTEVDLPMAPYDFNGGLYGLLLAALPLKAGLTGSLPAIADRENTLTSEPFHVLREEYVSAGSRGKVKAWVVETGHPGDYRMTFWLTKEPPYIIRLIDAMESNGRVLTWEML